MKPFKETCLFIVSEIVERGIIPDGLVTKMILENSSGIKMWSCLRKLSDVIVEH